MGKTGSCSDGRAMLSKSLIQFSAVGWGCVPSHPPYRPRPNYGRGNGSNGGLLQKDVCQHATASRTVVVSAPDPAAGHCGPTSLPETPRHSQASLAQSVVGSLLLSPRFWCAQGFVYALQVKVLVLTLCYPVDCNRPGSSVHGILQTRILEWVAIPFSRGSS